MSHSRLSFARAVRSLLAGSVVCCALLLPQTAVAQTPIVCGDTLSGEIFEGSQQDLYTFDGSADEAVLIAAVATSGTLAAHAELYGPNNVLIGSNVANNSTPNLVLPVAGTYTIVVRDFSFNRTGKYNLSLIFTAGGCAKGIGCGQTLGGTIERIARQDSYRFNANAGEAVLIAAVTTSGALAAHLELYGPNHVLVGSNVANNSTPNLVLPATGTYTLIVRDFSVNRIGGYNVSLIFTTGRCTTGVGCGQTLGGNINAVARQDSYRFNANAGEAVLIAAVTTSGALAAHLELYGPNHVLVGSNVANNSTPKLVLPATGSYTLIVRDFSVNRIGEYNVSLIFTTGRCGTGIAAGPPGRGNIDKIARQDAYVFCGVAGSSVIVAAVATSGPLAAHAEVFGPTGSSLGSNVANNSTPTLSLPSTGPHTIVVRDFSLNRTGAYNVSVTLIGPTCTLPAPIITSHPVDVTVTVGENAQFTVVATGIPEPAYQWQSSMNGGASWADLANAGPYQGAMTGTLTITSVTASLNGSLYRAIATNGLSSATSNAAALFVNLPRINVAAAFRGARATASSFYSAAYPPGGAIDGDRRGNPWGGGTGWNDATPDQWPDWLQIDFAGPQRIDEVDIFSLQDGYTLPAEPTLGMTFSLYGVTDFRVQYWTGTEWVDVPAGNVAANNQVWRQITFPALTTSAIRVLVTGALATWSRLAEVEAYTAADYPPPEAFGKATPVIGSVQENPDGVTLAWEGSSGAASYDYCVDAVNNAGCDTEWISAGPLTSATLSGLTSASTYYWAVRARNGGGTTLANAGGAVWWAFTTTGVSTRINVAAAAHGATATASSFYSTAYPPGGAIDGNRRGDPWGGGVGWNDGTPDQWPDWLQVDFAGSQTIEEVDIFSVQDEYTAPADPTLGMTFSLYGATDFQVQYWDGAQWVDIPGGSIAVNNQVWRQITFPALTTPAIRVFISGALATWSRLTEVEAYTPAP